MIIESRAPARIDLSGGTLDIWPLYLFHQHSMTINIAIDIYADVKLKTRRDKRVIIKSLDLDEEINVINMAALLEVPGFELFKEVIRFFKPKKGFELISNCRTPARSGLGGSSALLIALLGAFNRLANNKYKVEELIRLAKNLEARLIKVPTGVQDFYSALYGGVSCLHLGIEGVLREQITTVPGELERRLILCHSGASRLSNIINWNILKKHLDGDTKIFALFEKIRDISISMREALIAKDYLRMGKLFIEEWNTRRELPGKISLKKIESLKKIGLESRALSAKICGAGGGGCLLFWAEPIHKEYVTECLNKAGAQVLDFKISSSGLDVKKF